LQAGEQDRRKVCDKRDGGRLDKIVLSVISIRWGLIRRVRALGGYDMGINWKEGEKNSFLVFFFFPRCDETADKVGGDAEFCLWKTCLNQCGSMSNGKKWKNTA